MALFSDLAQSQQSQQQAQQMQRQGVASSSLLARVVESAIGGVRQ